MQRQYSANIGRIIELGQGGMLFCWFGVGIGLQRQAYIRMPGELPNNFLPVDLHHAGYIPVPPGMQIGVAPLAVNAWDTRRLKIRLEQFARPPE